MAGGAVDEKMKIFDGWVGLSCYEGGDVHGLFDVCYIFSRPDV